MHNLTGKQVSHHLVFLSLSVFVLAAASVLRLQGDERVVVPVVGLSLPEACYFKRLLGFGCPGCGLTRCFICLMHGEFSRAWQFNPGGYLCFAIVAFQFPYRTLQIWRSRKHLEEWRPVKLSASVGGLLVAVLILQWIWRQILGIHV